MFVSPWAGLLGWPGCFVPNVSHQPHGPPHTSPALPPSQGRQKLARFNAREFATLIIDILSEAKRRQQGKSLGSPTGGKGAAPGCAPSRVARYTGCGPGP